MTSTTTPGRSAPQAPTDGASDERRISTALLLLSGAIAAAVVFPLTWIVIRGVAVDPLQAIGLVGRMQTLRVVVNSVGLVVTVTLASVLVSVPLAYLTVRTDLPYSRVWTVLVSIPIVVPSYIGAFAYVSAFGPRHELGTLLRPFGIESVPRIYEAVPRIYGFVGTALVITLYTYPYVYLTTRAALKTMDGTLIEAALSLNQTRWQAFKRVTIPQLTPAIAAGALLTALYALSDFGTPAIMHFDVFTRVIYVEYQAWRYEYAAVLSLQLVVLAIAILSIESRVRGDKPLYGGTRGGTQLRTVQLGAWKPIALAFCTLVFLLTLGIPIGILGLWLLAGPATAAPTVAFEWGYALNSVYVAGLAAGIAAIAALPVAYLAARQPSRLGRLFERATYLGYAVPGVVVGLALVFFATTSGYTMIVYQTVPLLVFAYVVRFLPQAVGSTRASLLQVEQRLIEASYTLGRPPLETFRTVTLRLIAPGAVAGAALVFLTTMKELPATLILRPTGFDTLVTHIWAAQEASYYGYAATSAFILLAVSGLSMLLLLSQEGSYGR